MTDLTPTRSVLLELRQERAAMQEGYAFLDEKCLLLAGELLRQLAAYETALADYERLRRIAAGALRAAVARHGLDGLQCVPVSHIESHALHVSPRSLLGLPLQDAHLDPAIPPTARPLVTSPELRDCTDAFATLLQRATQLAALAGNLHRLRHEYRRTVRRTRALQNVLIPELDRSIADIESRLDEMDLEEARWQRRNGHP